MGKVSPKEKSWKVGKGRKQLRSSGKKYLKPGTLAQLRCNKSSGSGLGSGSDAGKSFSVLGKRRVTVLRSKKSKRHEDQVFDKSPLMLSPVNLVRQSSLVGTPKTPRFDECLSESRLESLPMDVLVCSRSFDCNLIYNGSHSRTYVYYLIITNLCFEC